MLFGIFIIFVFVSLCINFKGFLNNNSFIVNSTVWAEGLDNQKPTTPENLICLSLTGSTVDLMWDSSIDNVGVKYYKIFRNGKEIATSNTTEYTDKGLKSKKTYTYSIKACDFSGNISDMSSKIDVTPDSNKKNSKPGERNLSESIKKSVEKNNVNSILNTNLNLNSSSTEEAYLFAATGAEFTLVRMDDSTIKSWGRNAYGQLGLGDTTNRNTPTAINGLTGVKQISAGNAHVLALMEDGTVKAWGYNNYGQLGLGDTTNRSIPTTITGLSNVKQIVAGYDHSLALMNDGTVKSWGYNNKGQLGSGNTTNSSTPISVSGLIGVKQIAAGLYDSFALLNDGTVMSWGANDYGKLGTGDTSYTYKNIPTLITGLSEVKQLEVGYDHAFALMENGTVKAWGNNAQSRLGLGDTTNRSSPTTITGLTNVTELIAGRLHSIACLEDGTVLAWGANPYGQLGVGDTTGRTTPAVISGLSGISQIVTGPISNHSLVMMNDGTVKTWGYNYYGQLGLGDSTNRNVPTLISGLQFNVSPELNITAPIENDIFSEIDTNYIPTIEVYDINNDNLTCKYYIDNETSPRDTITITGTALGQTVTFSSLDISSLDEGNHTILFEVSDGIASPVVTGIQFMVDKSGPAFESFTAASTISSITVGGSAQDSIAGLNLLPYRFTIGSEISSWVTDTTFTTQNTLTPNTEYTVIFEAKDAKGHIANNTQNVFTKADAPSLTVNNVSSNTLTIGISDNNPNTTQYLISINNGSSYVSSNGTLTITPTWIEISTKIKNITGLIPETEYSIQIKAKNGADIETQLSQEVIGTTLEQYNDTEAPTTPQNLAVQSKTINTVTLSWDESTDNINVIRYDILNGTDIIGSTNGETTFTVTDVIANSLYEFTVKAKDAAGNLSLESNIVEYTLLLNEIDRASDGIVTASNEDLGSKENAFDDILTANWSINSNSGWIQYQFSDGNKYVVTKYTLTSAYNSPESDPKDWTIKGSNDGTNWVTLDTRTGENFTSRMQKKSYTFNNTIAYEYYRLEITNHSGDILQITEIELVEQLVDESTILFQKNYIIQNSSGKIYFVMQLPSDLNNIQNYKFIITYNINDFEVLDLCALTSSKELSTGSVSDTSIVIDKYEPGYIKILYNNSIFFNNSFVNIISFKIKNNDGSSLTYYIETN
jgi:Alpha-tubulin suppressor and related RCC1 domain-containing proteins